MTKSIYSKVSTVAAGGVRRLTKTTVVALLLAAYFTLQQVATPCHQCR